MSLELRSRPTRSRSGRPPARTAAVVVALALGLSGCGAGLRAQTYQERTTSDSTNEAIGELAVRHIRVLPPQGGDTYPAGSDARVTLVVVNDGPTEDRLQSATSDVSSRVELQGSGGRPVTEMVVPGFSTSSQYSFVLRGLTRELRPGQYTTMKLTFARNGSEEMLVPVEVTNRPGPKREYEVAHTDSEGNPIVKEEKGEAAESETSGEGGSEGSEARPELDNDGGDAGSGDQAPTSVGETSGDNNGGSSAATAPPEEG